MMKIVYLSRSIIPSRTANSIHVMNMCHAFASLGHDVTLLAPWTKKLEEKGVDDIFHFYGVEKSFKLEKLYSPNLKYLKKRIYSIRCLNRINEIKPDLVYGRDEVLAFYLASKAGYPVSFEKHMPLGESSFNDYFFRKMMLADNKARLILNCDPLKTMYHRNHGVALEKMYAAQNGSKAVNINELPEGVIVDGDQINIGYVGSLFKGRGIDIIIALAQRVNTATFHIIGGDAKDIAYWKVVAKSDNLVFHGFVEPQITYRYRNMCDILLAPYQTADEGNKISSYQSPIKLFEYMSSQKAIICSDLPNIREILDETKASLVSHVIIEEWVNALETLIENQEYRDQIAKNAYQDFLHNYTWQARAKKILDYLSDEKVYS